MLPVFVCADTRDLNQSVFIDRQKVVGKYLE